MKHSFLLFALLLITFTACETQELGDAPTSNQTAQITHAENPILKLENNHFDLGEIVEGEANKVDVFFSNQGNKDLQILEVINTCMISSNWTAQKIQTGKQASIELVIDSKDRLGPFRKTVKIKSNDLLAEQKITLSGKVVPKNKI